MIIFDPNLNVLIFYPSRMISFRPHPNDHSWPQTEWSLIEIVIMVPTGMINSGLNQCYNSCNCLGPYQVIVLAPAKILILAQGFKFGTKDDHSGLD